MERTMTTTTTKNQQTKINIDRLYDEKDLHLPDQINVDWLLLLFPCTKSVHATIASIRTTAWKNRHIYSLDEKCDKLDDCYVDSFGWCLSIFFSCCSDLYIYTHERRKEASQPRVNEQDNFENFSSSSFSSRLNSIAQENRSWFIYSKKTSAEREKDLKKTESKTTTTTMLWKWIVHTDVFRG